MLASVTRTALASTAMVAALATLFVSLNSSSGMHTDPTSGRERAEDQAKIVSAEKRHHGHTSLAQDTDGQHADLGSRYRTKEGKLIRPHVAMILADDFGWGNLGRHVRDSTGENPLYYGVHTPYLDSLINDGVLLERHYSFRICSPSRCSLQTGRLAAHVNIYNTGVTAHNRSDPVSGYAGIPVNMTGIAEKLKDAGYETHMVGKWDTGMATSKHTPYGRGYSSWLGYFQHANDYWTKSSDLQATGEIDNCLSQFKDFFVTNDTYKGPVYAHNLITGDCNATKECEETPDCPCYKEDIFKRQMLSHIHNYDMSKEEQNPLFLFHSFGLVHTPLQVPTYYYNLIASLREAAGGKFQTKLQRTYAAMVLYLDDTVKEIVKALERKKLWENTVLVFASDNGGPIYTPGSANNYPHRGGKYSDFDGGVRTNAFVAGGWLPDSARGTAHHGIVSIADWYATFCAFARVDKKDKASEAANVYNAEHGLPLLHPVDGIDQWEAITTGGNARPDALAISDKAVIKYTHGGLYKLVTGLQPYAVWTTPNYPNCSTYCPPTPYYTKDGPIFQDFKVMGLQINASHTEEGCKRIYWQHDCGWNGCLFRVDHDPGEHHDLSHNPDYAVVHKELLDSLAAHNLTIFKPGRGHDQLDACLVGVENLGYYGPFVSVPQWNMELRNWYSPRPPPTQQQRIEYLKLLLVLTPLNTPEGTAMLQRAFELIWPSMYRTCLFTKIDECIVNASAGSCYAGYCLEVNTFKPEVEAALAKHPLADDVAQSLLVKYVWESLYAFGTDDNPILNPAVSTSRARSHGSNYNKEGDETNDKGDDNDSHHSHHHHHH